MKRIKPFRLLVTGSRSWPESFNWPVQCVLDDVFSSVLSRHWNMILVHGHCRKGIDQLADDWALDVGCAVERWPAQWTHKAAGIRRNELMVQSRPDMCYAFIHNNSSGATHCANYAIENGIYTLKLQIDDSRPRNMLLNGVPI